MPGKKASFAVFAALLTALVLATSASDSSGSQRTITPPSPLAAIAMFPPTRKASPPNIFFSETPF